MADAVNLFNNFQVPNVYRLYRLKYNPLALQELSDEKIRQVYRFGRARLYQIIEDLTPILQNNQRRGLPVPVETQILTSFKFFAHGTSYRALAEQYGVGLGTVSRIITNVSNAIITVYGHRLDLFPTTAADAANVSEGFYQVANMPNVVGVVDGTLIPIQKPRVNSQVYMCRKSYFAINVMAVADANLRVTYLSPRFPGSAHDSNVFRQSRLYNLYENGRLHGLLLGDSGYFQKPYLMTPIINARTHAERRYNQAHKSTRNIIERTFGVLKSRFRCIDKSGGPLRLSPRKCVQIITAVCILHNIAIEDNLEQPAGMLIDEDEDYLVDNLEVDLMGINARQNLVNHFDV